MAMKKLEIDLATWARGGLGKGAPRLLNDKGERCCLGFLGRSCGVLDEEALDTYLPSELDPEPWPPELFRESGWSERPGKYSELSGDELEYALAAINDEVGVDEETRQAWVAEGFRSIGWEVEFVNREPGRAGQVRPGEGG